MSVGGGMIRARRTALGRTLRDLSKSVRLSAATIHRIETGDKIPDNQEIEEFAKVLGLDKKLLKQAFDKTRTLKTWLRSQSKQSLEVVYSHQKLNDIRETMLWGTPALGLKWAREEAKKLRVAVEDAANSSVKPDNWPAYELLAWMLLEQGEAFAFFDSPHQAFRKQLELATTLDALYVPARQDLPKLLAEVARAEAHYIAGNYDTALNHILRVLECDDPLYRLGAYLGPRWWLVFLRIKAVSAAQLGARTTAREAMGEISDYMDRKSVSNDVYHLGMNTKARVLAIQGSKSVWKILDEVADIERDENLRILRLIEIKSALEAMRHLRDPDRGRVEQLREEALTLSWQNKRHMEQIDENAKKVLSLLDH